MESDRYGKTSWIKRHKGVVLWGDMKYVSVGREKVLKMLYELHLNIFRQERVSSLLPKGDASKPESLFQRPTYKVQKRHL
jgi:hypothetical protein